MYKTPVNGDRGMIWAGFGSRPSFGTVEDVNPAANSIRFRTKDGGVMYGQVSEWFPIGTMPFDEAETTFTEHHSFYMAALLELRKDFESRVRDMGRRYMVLASRTQPTEAKHPLHGKVAQPDYGALGLGSAEEAEGRN